MAVSEVRQTAAARIVDAGDASWRRFLLSHPNALPYHHPAWVETLADAYGYEPLAAVVHSSAGAVVGGLTFVPVGGRIRPRQWISLPFTDFCPPLARDGLTVREVGVAVDELRREHDVAGLEVRAPLVGLEGLWTARGVRHALALTDPERLFAGFKSQVRRNIRKGEATGVTVRVGDRREDLTRTYFDLHADTRRRLGVPPQPRRFFDSLWRYVIEPELGFLLLAYHEGIAVAGAVYLEWNGVIVYKYGASDRRHWPLRPNNLLLWSSMQRGWSSGAHTLDLGRSDLDDKGLRAFKRSWGAPEEPLDYTSFGRARQGPGRGHDLLRTLLAKSPTWFGRMIGASLYKLAA